MEIKIKKLHKDAKIPKYMTDGSAGFDICSLEPVELFPGEIKNVHTGLGIQIPEGTVLNIRQRSGLSLIYPSYISNGVGTIDSDYRGEIMIPLINHTKGILRVSKYERIAQGVLTPVIKAQIKEVKKLDETKRGTGGFGHTGDK